jgi:hypothetical protein
MAKRKHPKVFQGYRILYLLMSTKEPYTVHEVANELEVSPVTAYNHLRELWSMEFVHICAWDRTYRHWMPVYKWGEGNDKPKPKPLTTVQISRRKLAKKNLSDETKRAIRNIYNYSYRQAQAEGDRSEEIPR